VYDTTVLRPFGARDSSAITQRDPHPEEPGTGVAGARKRETGAADRADDLLISFWADDRMASATAVPGAGQP
jgi:hypothetical protein